MVPAFVERYWFAIALGVGTVIWVWRTRRRIRSSGLAPPRPGPPQGPVGPVLFRGADFTAKVELVHRFHARTIGGLVAFGLLGVGAFAVPGLSDAARAVVAGGAAVGAVVSFLILGFREGPLLRQLGLYCPQCGDPLVGRAEDRVPAEVVVTETGQCRCGFWLLDPADLPSG
jgi:hypothetical protein